MVCEEMVARDEDQLFRFSGLGHDRFQRFIRSELVVLATEKQLRLTTVVQEPVRIESSFGFHRSSQRNQCANVRIKAASLQSHRSPEREPRKDDGEREFLLEPGERCRDVADFLLAVVFSGAQTCAAKVEAQDWKSERV